VADIVASARIYHAPRWRWSANVGEAIKKLFAETFYSAQSPPGVGAVVPPDRLAKMAELVPRIVQRLIPGPFDLIAIVAAPASGTTTVLLSPTNFGVVPQEMRAVIDGFTTILEGAVGPIPGPRIPGAGVLITWRFLVDGNAAYPYNAVTTIIDDTGQDRPLFEIPPNRQFTVDVTNVDPAGLYLFLGVRVRGRLIPWNYDNKGGR
jgi:hypothetical protein